MSETKCWHVGYYFQRPTNRKVLRADVCGCVVGDTRKEAIENLLAECEGCDDGRLDIKILRYVATRRPSDHICSAA